jgi:hypothetical protein
MRDDLSEINRQTKQETGSQKPLLPPPGAMFNNRKTIQSYSFGGDYWLIEYLRQKCMLQSDPCVSL